MVVVLFLYRIHHQGGIGVDLRPLEAPAPTRHTVCTDIMTIKKKGNGSRIAWHC